MDKQRIAFAGSGCDPSRTARLGLTGMDRTDDSLIALRRILRATELFGKELAQAAGLSPVQFRVMQLVAEKGLTTPKALSVQMGVTQGTITALLDKLQKQGMLTRERSEVDRRQMNIAVTERGRETLANAPDPLQQRYVRKFEIVEGLGTGPAGRLAGTRGVDAGCRGPGCLAGSRYRRFQGPPLLRRPDVRSGLPLRRCAPLSAAER